MGTFRAVKVVYRNRFEDAAPYEREFEGIRKFEPISRSHDGLVDVLQIGRNDAASSFYYVMELADDQERAQDIDSTTYRSRTLQSESERGGRMPIEACIEIGLTLTSALEHLHQSGLIHRDIKPSNIVFVNGTPKLADIGLVTEAGAEATLVGTPGFISPEGPGTPQADVYSLGKVLYQIAMGKDPRNFPDPLTNLTELPEQRKLLGMNTIILKACRSGMRHRYQSAQQMHDELLALRSGTAPRRSKRATLVVGCGILAALISGAYWRLTLKNDRQSADTQNISANPPSASNPNTLSAEEISAGFRLLFNGKDLSGWTAPADNWQVQDGAIARVKGGGDIEYRVEPVSDDFELRFDWKVERGSHSAVLYRPGNYQYHIVDNRDPPPREGRKMAGALWGFVGPQVDWTRPVGQWNQARIVCKGSVIEHWLNGQKVVAVDYAKPEWKPAVRGFQQRTRTKLEARGRFLTLQDRQSAVCYRSIRLRTLE
jgi:serine/threonine protein kinase